MRHLIWRRVALAAVFALLTPAHAQQSAHKLRTASTTDCVVLLHGLVRSAKSMNGIARTLSETGYRVANIDYPSRMHRIEVLADDAVKRGIEQCNASGDGLINFVTHSLGGILVRYYLKRHALHNLGSVVMLGPPNNGSEVVDAWRNVPGYALLNGPAGNQLGTDVNSIFRQLGPADFPVGVIAGTRSINLILSIWLPNPDDGKVSVESTKLKGMRDFITVPVSHPFLPGDHRVTRQVISFLREGKFDHIRGGQERANETDQLRCAETGELTDCSR